MNIQSQTTIVFAVLLCICTVVLAYLCLLPIESFSCGEVFSNTFNKIDMDESSSHKITSQYTSLVGYNKTCTDKENTDIIALNLMDNGKVEVGDIVYAKYPKNGGQYYKASVVKIYKAKDKKSIDDGGPSKLINRSFPFIHKISRTDPSYFANARPTGDGYLSLNNAHELMLVQNFSDILNSPIRGNNVERQRLNVLTEDSYDIVFTNQNIQNQHMKDAQNTLDIRYTISEIKRTPHRDMISECAQNCIQAYPNTWGIQVGKCLPHKCACMCVVPKSMISTCSKHAPIRLQESMNDNTQMDLHSINKIQKAESDMLSNLNGTCKTTGWVKQPSFKCNIDNHNDSALPKATTTKEPSSCCPDKCSQYTGQEYILCNDENVLQSYLERLPKTQFMGKGFCKADPKNTPSNTKDNINCKQERDIPCIKRNKNECETFNYTYNKDGKRIRKSNNQCAYHINDPSIVEDKHGTGCYDADQCFVQKNKTTCNANPVCNWDSKLGSRGFCMDEEFCEVECSNVTDATRCIKNPYCTWHKDIQHCSANHFMSVDAFNKKMHPSTKHKKSTTNMICLDATTKQTCEAQDVCTWNKNNKSCSTKKLHIPDMSHAAANALRESV